jgi:predicted transcriptional regulator YdeE
MPIFHAHKSIRIEAPLGTVYKLVRDFGSWPRWSPWLIAEPTAKVTLAEDGRGYSWEGEVTGMGSMEITGGEPQRSIDYRLTFLKPWKSVNTARFSFLEQDGGTTATWTMEGTLPWFLFWMKGMMSGWIGADFDRGLKMLKDLAETGAVPSSLEFSGIQKAGGFHYAGVRSSCATSEIGPSMARDLNQLVTGLDGGGIKPTGPAFSISHSWDPVKGRTEYTVAVPVAESAVVPARFTRGEIPSCRAYIVVHTGAYRHLGNAWAAGMMHGRGKRFTADKKTPCFEIYENDPAVTPEVELVTRVHFPAK